MSGRYLLDTNTASCVIRGEPPQVRRRLAALPMGAVAISAITEGELRAALRGCRRRVPWVR